MDISRTPLDESQKVRVRAVSANRNGRHRSARRLLVGGVVVVGLVVGAVSPVSAAAPAPIVLPSSQNISLSNINSSGNGLEGIVTRTTNKAVFEGVGYQGLNGPGGLNGFSVTATFKNNPTGSPAQTCTATGGGQSVTKNVNRKLPAVNFGTLPANTTSSSQVVTSRGTGYRRALTLLGPVWDFIDPYGLRLRVYENYATPAVNAQRDNMRAHIATEAGANAIMSRLYWAGMGATGATASIVSALGIASKTYAASIGAVLYAACAMSISGGWYNAQEIPAVSAGQEYDGQFARIFNAAPYTYNEQGWQRFH
jgi:hypothetical protein